MEYFCGIDVSLEYSSLCVVDGQGRIVHEAKVLSECDALIAWFQDLDLPLSRIGLEAGSLSQWLYAGLAEAGLVVELIETRHIRDAFKAMPVKTDRNDAHGIAQPMRLGWFRPVHCKSLPAQEVRAVLKARKLLQTKLHDVEMSLGGILRGFGLKVGRTTPRTFEGRIKELVTGHPTLTDIAEALLSARAAIHRQFQAFERRVRALARGDDRAKLLMSAPGVGVLVSLTYTSAIDEPDRFKRSKQVGAHFGLTPTGYQSGETDISGRISKIGDREVRSALYEAANALADVRFMDKHPIRDGKYKKILLREEAFARKNKLGIHAGKFMSEIRARNFFEEKWKASGRTVASLFGSMEELEVEFGLEWRKGVLVEVKGTLLGGTDVTDYAHAAIEAM